jgi:hypothetical protein
MRNFVILTIFWNLASEGEQLGFKNFLCIVHSVSSFFFLFQLELCRTQKLSQCMLIGYFQLALLTFYSKPVPTIFFIFCYCRDPSPFYPMRYSAMVVNGAPITDFSKSLKLKHLLLQQYTSLYAFPSLMDCTCLHEFSWFPSPCRNSYPTPLSR